MIASVIGRRFLQTFNDHYGKKYSAKEFFDKEFFPLFYDGNKYLQWVQNTPFVQMKKGQKVELLTPEERIGKRDDLHAKVDEGFRDASAFIGASASEVDKFGSTSGQVTDISIEVEPEEVYLSWIGGGLGIGVAGGLSFHFEHPEMLLTLYKGWKIYRKFLNEASMPALKGNQINTWNGQWLAYWCGKRREPKEVDFHSFSNEGRTTVKSGIAEFDTIQWNQLLFAMSKKWDIPMLMGYVYSLGQTNTTLGFFLFQIQACSSLRKFYQTLFGEAHESEDRKFYETLYGIHIKRACEKGAIGMLALQPADLKKYMGSEGKKIKLTKPKLGKDEQKNERLLQKDRENIITYRAYKTWLLAMITKNKEEMLDYTSNIAKSLMAYRNEGAKGSTKRPNKISIDLLGAKNKRGFITALMEILKEVNSESVDLLKELRDRVHLMSSEDFSYFLVLLKFDYAYVERENN